MQIWRSYLQLHRQVAVPLALATAYLLYSLLVAPLVLVHERPFQMEPALSLVALLAPLMALGILVSYLRQLGSRGRERGLTIGKLLWPHLALAGLVLFYLNQVLGEQHTGWPDPGRLAVIILHLLTAELVVRAGVVDSLRRGICNEAAAVVGFVLSFVAMALLLSPYLGLSIRTFVTSLLFTGLYVTTGSILFPLLMDTLGTIHGSFYKGGTELVLLVTAAALIAVLALNLILRNTAARLSQSR